MSGDGHSQHLAAIDAAENAFSGWDESNERDAGELPA
jgi:hypothetical protein